MNKKLVRYFDKQQNEIYIKANTDVGSKDIIIKCCDNDACVNTFLYISPEQARDIAIKLNEFSDMIDKKRN